MFLFEWIVKNYYYVIRILKFIFLLLTKTNVWYKIKENSEEKSTIKNFLMVQDERKRKLLAGSGKVSHEKTIEKAKKI